MTPRQCTRTPSTVAVCAAPGSPGRRGSHPTGARHALAGRPVADVLERTE
ncbi:hypothetical protein [Streptomyces sp. WM6378]|nr:hypothetical protein [Streptomyces sp. WM6378]